MAKGFKNGVGGGNPLNFEVVGNPQPQNPKANTIWINTDVKIAVWVFSATEPEALIEGIVWIPTGTSSPAAFNALKKNGLQVYPEGAMQYIAGAWVNKTAQIYQGGKWVDLATYLYNNGDENTDLTGGWGAYALKINGNVSASGKTPTISKLGDGSIKMTYPDTPAVSDANGGVVRTMKKINLSEYSALKFTGYMAEGSGSYYVKLCVWSSMGSAWSDNIVASIAAKGETNKTVRTYPALDISSLSGEYYIGFGLYTNNPGLEVLMKELKLER